MRFQNHLVTENFVGNIFNKLIKKPAGSAMKEIKKGFDTFISFFQYIDNPADQKQILSTLNRSLGTSYRNFDDVRKTASKRIGESHELNEDFKHWWNEIKAEGFFNIKFYPALQVWFELGGMLTNFLKDQPIDQTTIKKAAFYAILWLLIASGGYIKGYLKWKKDNPEEYASERGKKTPMSKRDLVKFA